MKKLSVKTTMQSASKNRDSIGLLGGEIYYLETMLMRGVVITKKDFNLLKKHLSRIDSYDQKIWKQLIDFKREIVRGK